MNRDTETIAIDLSDILDSVKDNATFDDYLDIQNYQERKIYIDEEITSYSVDSACRAISRYNKEDKGIPTEERKPIMLYLNTVGGAADAGYQLIDLIQVSKTPVYAVNRGICYSMGFFIFITASKRFSYKNSSFLLHDGSRYAGDSASKTRDLMGFYDKIDERVKQTTLECTNITSEVYDEKSRVEWYMFADEAKSLGAVDYIIGEDCELDDVI